MKKVYIGIIAVFIAAGCGKNFSGLSHTENLYTSTVVDDTADVGEYSSLALDSSGNPYIAYYDLTDRSLRMAYWSSTSNGWVVMTVDPGNGADVGMFSTLALNKSQQPVIAYYDNTHGQLKLAVANGNKLTTGSFTITVVDGGKDGNVGGYASLAINDSDQPVISYFDFTHNALKVAIGTQSGYNITTVDSLGVIGLYTSDAIDPKGNPAISYYDASNGLLKYAHFTGSTWSITTVDGGNGLDAGRYTSLAIRSDGTPFISYYDATNEQLKCAWFDNSNNRWSLNIADGTYGVGTDTSLALDSYGYPHITYFDGINGKLRYTWYNGVGWERDIVDGVGVVGLYSSLKLDANDQAHISYRDYKNRWLKYASYRMF